MIFRKTRHRSLRARACRAVSPTWIGGLKGWGCEPRFPPPAQPSPGARRPIETAGPSRSLPQPTRRMMKKGTDHEEQDIPALERCSEHQLQLSDVARSRGVVEKAPLNPRPRAGNSLTARAQNFSKKNFGSRQFQMWITRSKASSTLSCIISDRVGWGKTVSIRSSSVVSNCRPTT